eukprot:533772-Pelagomonas_calceolata.AAC.11
MDTMLMTSTRTSHTICKQRQQGSVSLVYGSSQQGSVSLMHGNSQQGTVSLMHESSQLSTGTSYDARHMTGHVIQDKATPCCAMQAGAAEHNTHTGLSAF